MLPRPTADPMAAKMNTRREVKAPRLVASSLETVTTASCSSGLVHRKPTSGRSRTKAGWRPRGRGTRRCPPGRGRRGRASCGRLPRPPARPRPPRPSVAADQQPHGPAAVERGEGEADPLRRRLGGVGDGDRDVVAVELRVTGEQGGHVAVGSDAQHHDVELATAVLAQPVGVRRRAGLHVGDVVGGGHLVHRGGPDGVEERRPGAACVAVLGAALRRSARRPTTRRPGSSRPRSRGRGGRSPGAPPRRCCRR